MIKTIDKNDPAHARTLIITKSSEYYLNWSEESMADQSSELFKVNMDMLKYYEQFENSSQEIWTDDVPTLKAKYDPYGFPAEYIDMNKVLGKYDLSKGERWSTSSKSEKYRS